MLLLIAAGEGLGTLLVPGQQPLAARKQWINSHLQVHGRLQLDDGVPDPVVVSYVAVDRPVYVIVTVPPALGSGPLQHVSDVVGATLPAVGVRVR